MGTIITICNHKGGVGKTTSIINLAAALAELGKKVLVIDADGQANATMVLYKGDPYETPNTTLEIFSNPSKQFKDLKHVSRIPNVSIIPTNTKLLRTEREIQGSLKAIMAFREALDSETEAAFDFILIDSPPNLGSFVTNALVISDFYIIPIAAEDGFAIKGMKDLQQLAAEVKKGLNTKLQCMGLLITRYDPRTNASKSQKQNLEQHFGKESIFKTIINENTSIARAVIAQKTVFDYDAHAQGAIDYLKFGREVLNYVEGHGRNNEVRNESPELSSRA